MFASALCVAAVVSMGVPRWDPQALLVADMSNYAVGGENVDGAWGTLTVEGQGVNLPVLGLVDSAESTNALGRSGGALSMAHALVNSPILVEGGPPDAVDVLGATLVQHDVDNAFGLVVAVVTWVAMMTGVEDGAAVDHRRRQGPCDEEIEALCPPSDEGLVRCLAARRDELSSWCRGATSAPLTPTTAPASEPLPTRYRSTDDPGGGLEMLLLLCIILICATARQTAMYPIATNSAHVSPTHVAVDTEGKVRPVASTPDRVFV
jgi:hypothetical protein